MTVRQHRASWHLETLLYWAEPRISSCYILWTSGGRGSLTRQSVEAACAQPSGLGETPETERFSVSMRPHLFCGLHCWELHTKWHSQERQAGGSPRHISKHPLTHTEHRESSQTERTKGNTGATNTQTSTKNANSHHVWGEDNSITPLYTLVDILVECWLAPWVPLPSYSSNQSISLANGMISPSVYIMDSLLPPT